MAFKLGDIIIDRIQYGIAEDFEGNPLYTLTQLADATIDITAESKDSTDKDGTLIKRFWTGKTGTFSANNAMINLNILGSMSGSDPIVASSGSAQMMPRIITVKAGETATLTGAVEGTITCNAISANGNMGKAYTKGAAASESEFGFTTSGTLFTPPTDENETKYIVKYNRSVEDGVVIKNKADKFPKTVRLTLKALCVDPCTADTLRACYIVLPSFQLSPEVSLSLQTDTQLEYKGDLQVNYCSEDKGLYEVYIATEDEEDDE